MTPITAQEAARYAEVWGAIDRYGDHAPALRYLPLLREVCPPPALLLDAGCGSGKGAVAAKAAGYDVRLCDLTDEGLVAEARALPFRTACLWQPLRPQLGLGRVDAVLCTDVLEHIPPQFTMLVVDQLLAVADRGVLLAVSLQPDGFGVWTGGPLHQTVQPFTWWRDSLREVGCVAEARDLITDAVFWVTHGR